jgi:hypothetical protein
MLTYKGGRRAAGEREALDCSNLPDSVEGFGVKVNRFGETGTIVPISGRRGAFR